MSLVELVTDVSFLVFEHFDAFHVGSDALLHQGEGPLHLLHGAVLLFKLSLQGLLDLLNDSELLAALKFKLLLP